MPFFGAFGWLSVLLLLGVVLRAKIGLFQRFLFPSAIIGGFIGFILISVGWMDMSHDTFVLFAIHLFTINFISIGLTGTDEAAQDHSGSLARSIFRGMSWMGLMFIAMICIQSLLGGGIIYLTNQITQPIYTGLGMLAGVGFSQGPGQAVALAAVWENNFHIPHAVSIGLSFAAVGFFVASLVGIPLANWAIRRGLGTDKENRISRSVVTGLYAREKRVQAGQLSTHSGNIDGLAFQLALVLAVYFLTYYECAGLKYLLPQSLKPVAFGCMFVWGMFTAFLVRWILKKLGLAHFIDNNVQRRITGVSVDYMIAATLLGVKIASVKTHILPIVSICLVVSLVTIGLVLFFGRRMPEYGVERMLAVFGTVTGTGASGLMLLRIVDPEFKSPAAAELALFNLVTLVPLMPLLVISYTLPQMNVLVLFGCLAGYSLLSLACLKIFGFWKAPSW
ncbi:MAG: hypothetical protein MI747_08815 [Desulfobacterales bacterium]|nr:hypothetical protein [Desulfobacterales bacterium]